MIININKRKLLLVSGLAAIVVIAVVLGLYFGSKNRTEEASRVLTGGAVTSNGVECAQIGADILRQNGSAVDAAVAVLFCEGVTCPQSAGLGGGFFLTLYNRDTGIVQTLDAREIAPSAATKNMYLNKSSAAVEGGLAVAVPGEIKGYWMVHQKYGQLEWKTLIQPTIDLCRRGHLVTDYLARILKVRQNQINSIPSLREVFINPNTNETWRTGDRIKRLALANSLEVIAEEGADALYNRNGTLLPKLMRDLKEFGSIITEEDFYNYEARWLPPAHTKLSDGYSVYSMPLPGSGHVLNYMLNILDGFDDLSANDPLTWHRIVEAFKYGYGLRTKLGDPSFVQGIEGTLRKLTNKHYAAFVRDGILDNTTFHTFEQYGAEFANEEDHGTAHVSILAPNGDAVAATSTINYVLGAMIRSPSTGIILNDEMDDFSIPGTINSYGLRASPSNYIVPGKRPLSSMCPTIVIDTNGDVRIIAGSAGGSKITTATLLVILRHLYFGEDLETIIHQQRVHHQLAPMLVEYEQGFNQNVLDGLIARGHELKEAVPDAGFAAATAIIRDRNDKLSATYDPRRAGSIEIIQDL
ncbi:glutathione hydrolase 1 proenzyme-like isoform X6 [Wyeomyia smithii]|uniref:glutathione hydrolase 1 proenzyme-like isoform X6 n=1 Tax=Wyeomyia smithii TaxID=174621 RepID=UPI002467D7DD|nr:glutathione hydrolase 1 proenzyme-like isoform X6 [Wyeomyia smithii]